MALSILRIEFALKVTTIVIKFRKFSKFCRFEKIHDYERHDLKYDERNCLAKERLEGQNHKEAQNHSDPDRSKQSR